MKNQESFVEFGGGALAPAVAAHLARRGVQVRGACAVAADPQLGKQVQYGGGAIAPAIAAHLSKVPSTGSCIPSQSVTHAPKGMQIGGGAFAPAVAVHLAKANAQAERRG